MKSLQRIDELVDDHDRLNETVKKITSLPNMLLIITAAYVALQTGLGRPWQAAR
jgi:hypothetical protein